jgi:hypothetical protein
MLICFNAKALLRSLTIDLQQTKVVAHALVQSMIAEFFAGPSFLLQHQACHFL